MTALGNQIMDYETGQLGTYDILDLFSELITTGMAWTLQGSYGRMAASLIDHGLISKDGKIQYDTVERLLEGRE